MGTNDMCFIKSKFMILLLGSLFAGTLFAAPVGQETGVWVKDQSSQCQLWNSYPKPNESVIWSGACKDGYADGLGIAEWYRGGQLTSLNLINLESGFWYGKRKTWDVKGNSQYFFAFRNQPPVSITEDDYNKMSPQQIFEKYVK